MVVVVVVGLLCGCGEFMPGPFRRGRWVRAYLGADILTGGGDGGCVGKIRLRLSFRGVESRNRPAFSVMS